MSRTDSHGSPQRASELFVVRADERPLRPATPSSGADDDSSLLRRISDGDRAAFEALFHRYYGRVLRYLEGLVGRRARAEELASDVLLTVWRKAGSFEGRSRPSTWILGIAYRLGVRAYRELSGRPQSLTRHTLEAWEVDQGIDEEERRRTREILASAIQSLSPEQRAVLQLTYVDGYSYAEIAEITGVPVNTVKTRMFYARRRLRAAWPQASAATGDPGKREVP